MSKLTDSQKLDKVLVEQEKMREIQASHTKKFEEYDQDFSKIKFTLIDHEDRLQEMKMDLQDIKKAQNTMMTSLDYIVGKLDLLLTEDSARTEAKRRQDETLENHEHRIKRLEQLTQS